MGYNLGMSGFKLRGAALAATIFAAAFLVFLAWKGLREEPDGLPELTWREADEADLF